MLEVEIEYCPTDNMVADYFTNPLQGKKFFQFRKTIMNLKSLKRVLNLDHRSVLEDN